MALLLSLLLVFLIILGASVRAVSRQARETTNQVQEEQAFHLAEAGVQYTLWLLDPDGGGYLPAALPPVTAHPVIDAAGKTVGTFFLVFSNGQPDSVTVTSIGKDAVIMNRCQTIVADIAASDGVYRVVSWDHLVSTGCTGGPALPSVPGASPPPVGTPPSP